MKGVVLSEKVLFCLPSAFQKPLQNFAPLKPIARHLLRAFLKAVSRTFSEPLLGSARSHDPLGVRPTKVGFGERGLLEKGSFQKSPFSRDSREFRDSRDFREPQTVENKRESDHFLEILENLETLEIL